MTRHISIAEECSAFPAGRFACDGPYTGEVFHTKHLVPALRGHERVVVNLDGTLGIGCSFLDEAFGGLVRVEGFDADDLAESLQIEGGVGNDAETAQGYLR